MSFPPCGTNISISKAMCFLKSQIQTSVGFLSLNSCSFPSNLQCWWYDFHSRWLGGKELPANGSRCRRCWFDPWVGKIPGGGHGNLLQYSCLENSHGQRSLAGCSPWGHKELDMTEQVSQHSTGNFTQYTAGICNINLDFANTHNFSTLPIYGFFNGLLSFLPIAPPP